MADEAVTEQDLKGALERMHETRVVEHIDSPDPDGAAVYMPEGLEPDQIPEGSKVTIVPSSYVISEE